MTSKQDIIDLARECGLTSGMLEFISLGQSPIERFYHAAHARGLESARPDEFLRPGWTYEDPMWGIVKEIKE